MKRSWQENLVFLTDLFIVALCYVGAYFIRFDGLPSKSYLSMMIETLPLVLVITMSALIYFKVNRSMWEYASIKDLSQIIKAVTVSSVIIVAVVMVLHMGYPRSIFIIDWLLLIVGLSGVRFFIRISRPFRGYKRNGNGRRKKVLIVGAGDAGEMILREMVYRYSHNYKVVGMIDDDPKKYRRRIHGVTVLGSKQDIPHIVKEKRVWEIVIAIPSLNSEQMRDIVNYCIKSGVKYRTVPNISNVMDGTVKVKELREVRIEDLLNRDEILVDRQKIGSYIRGKRVLVTGAGGSIGSEICRQVARFMPEKLILFEKAENALFYIDMELEQYFTDVNKVPVIGDICDRKRVKEVFGQHKPEIIFHAAAHKHVPLMEVNFMEAIKNNVFGTKVISEEAIDCGVDKFIMLSTDKAVAPMSLMGVSKRIAEMYAASMQESGRTELMAVRFGNVLGSEGSVIPKFKKQIQRGGPVTVTHPDMKRYFMTIPEAVGLVLEAGYMGEGGEIFILEMGKQIKIIDLANELIRLSGLEPNKDIEIVFTGLRPGEKMHEALVGADEMIAKTSHEKIHIVRPQKQTVGNIINEIKILEGIVSAGDMGSLLKKLKQIVPAYTPSALIRNMPQAEEIFHNRGADILVVDDDSMVQGLLRKFLEGRGHNTFLASSAKEALGRAKKNNIHIAIVDVRLPGFMDGLGLLQNLKKINENTKVILITGFGTEKIEKLSKDFGAYAYLEKPFDLVDIKTHVEDIVRIKNAHFVKIHNCPLEEQYKGNPKH